MYVLSLIATYSQILPHNFPAQSGDFGIGIDFSSHLIQTLHWMNDETEGQRGKELTQGHSTSGDTARTRTRVSKLPFPHWWPGLLVLLSLSLWGERVVYKGRPAGWAPVDLSEEGEQGWDSSKARRIPREVWEPAMLQSRDQPQDMQLF